MGQVLWSLNQPSTQFLQNTCGLSQSRRTIVLPTSMSSKHTLHLSPTSDSSAGNWWNCWILAAVKPFCCRWLCCWFRCCITILNPSICWWNTSNFSRSCLWSRSSSLTILLFDFTQSCWDLISFFYWLYIQSSPCPFSHLI